MINVKAIILTTKGIIRDQVVRRWAMFVLLLAAMVMVAAGTTFLAGLLAENKWIFLIYWIVCFWLVMTVTLLAVFDMLMVRLLLRRERRRLKDETFGRNRGDGENIQGNDRE